VRRLPAALVVLGLLVVASVASALQGQERGSSLGHYDFGKRTSHFELPGRLDEISGLAMTSDGRMFTHDDERGRVYELDPKAGKIIKMFSLGKPSIRGDFEAIAIVGERFFMMTSDGLLYEFREAGAGEQTPYQVTDTELGSVCEVEGLDYDPQAEALLIACKVSVVSDALVVHRLALDPSRDPLPSIRIPREGLRPTGLGVDFAPSAIVVDPDGTLLLASARTEALVEVDRDGHVLAGVHLSHDRHPQAEGLAFGLDGTLYISDEAHGHHPRLTSYARRRDARSGS
jgi:uncharacterized protein YjiK